MTKQRLILIMLLYIFHANVSFAQYDVQRQMTERTLEIIHNPYSLLLAGSILTNYTTKTGGPVLIMTPTEEPSTGTEYDYHTTQTAADVHNLTMAGSQSGNLVRVSDGLVYSWDMDGVNDYWSIVNHADLRFIGSGTDTAFSVVMVIEVVASGDDQVIISKWDETTGSEAREWQIYLNGAESLFLNFFDETNNDNYSSKTTNPVSSGWHHVLITYPGDNVGANIVIYIDGESVAMTEDICLVCDYMRASSTNVLVGARFGTDGNPGSFYKGKISTIAIIDEEVSTANQWPNYMKTRGYWGL